MSLFLSTKCACVLFIVLLLVVIINTVLFSEIAYYSYYISIILNEKLD